jgi:hypothetical protein
MERSPGAVKRATAIRAEDGRRVTSAEALAVGGRSEHHTRFPTPCAPNVAMLLFGRALQMIGLALLPLAIIMQLTGLGLREMLMLAVVGAVIFWIGRLMEGLGRK